MKESVEIEMDQWLPALNAWAVAKVVFHIRVSGDVIVKNLPPEGVAFAPPKRPAKGRNPDLFVVDKVHLKAYLDTARRLESELPKPKMDLSQRVALLEELLRKMGVERIPEGGA